MSELYCSNFGFGGCNLKIRGRWGRGGLYVAEGWEVGVGGVVPLGSCLY